MKNCQFPKPGVGDKMPKTVASFVSAGMAAAAGQRVDYRPSSIDGVSPQAIPAMG